ADPEKISLYVLDDHANLVVGEKIIVHTTAAERSADAISRVGNVSRHGRSAIDATAIFDENEIVRRVVARTERAGLNLGATGLAGTNTGDRLWCRESRWADRADLGAACGQQIAELGLLQARAVRGSRYFVLRHQFFALLQCRQPLARFLENRLRQKFLTF